MTSLWETHEPRTSMASLSKLQLDQSIFPQLKNINSIRTLISQSPNLTTIPSNYAFLDAATDSASVASELEIQLPVVNFTLLSSNCPRQRSDAVQQLGHACRDWGFFMVLLKILTTKFSIKTQITDIQGSGYILFVMSGDPSWGSGGRCTAHD